MKDLHVRDIMSCPLITISRFETLEKASHLFSDHKIHHIPVLENDQLVGMLSSTDLERNKYGKSFFIRRKEDSQNKALLSATLVGMVMSERVETISARESVYNAYRLFKKNTYRSLPVVEQGELVGIITPMDFLDYIFNQSA